MVVIYGGILVVILLYVQSFTLLHSEWPKLCELQAILSAIGLRLGKPKRNLGGADKDPDQIAHPHSLISHYYTPSKLFVVGILFFLSVSLSA